MTPAQCDGGLISDQDWVYYDNITLFCFNHQWVTMLNFQETYIIIQMICCYVSFTCLISLMNDILWIPHWLESPDWIYLTRLERYAIRLNQQARDVETMLVECWPIVCDAGPSLNQHCFNASCLLGTLKQARHIVMQDGYWLLNYMRLLHCT